eukprot:1963314-Alexandrium_andersonii.AAC.1
METMNEQAGKKRRASTDAPEARASRHPCPFAALAVEEGTGPDVHPVGGGSAGPSTSCASSSR